MKRRLFPASIYGCIAAAWLGLPSGLHAQLPVQSTEAHRIEGETVIEWFGYQGRTYFIQVSDASDPLRKWTWAPVIEAGNDGLISYEFGGDAPRGFARLQYIDAVPPSGISLEFWDADGDGMPNGWEIENGFNPLNPTGVDGSEGDLDGDGLTNAEEYQNDSNPWDEDSDNDGITDGGEVDQGYDPNNSSNTPEAEWFIVVGDLEEDQPMARNRTIVIPAGQARIVVVAMASQEYPVFTVSQSEYNDILSWSVQPTVGDSISGEININSRHVQLQQAEAANRALFNFSPTHVETYRTFQAPPNEPLVVDIDLSVTNIGDSIAASAVMVGFLPIKFEITHIEKERDQDGVELGTAVNPGANALLRDEIADLKITVPTFLGTDWDLTIDLETEDIKFETLGDRGSVQMYDFGRIDGTNVIPLSLAEDDPETVGVNEGGNHRDGPYDIKLPQAKGGIETFKVIVNKSGGFKVRVKSADEKIDVASQEISVANRIRKYANLASHSTHDLNQHDQAFVNAADHWGAVYQHQVDSVDRLKAIGMTESELGITDATDIMTIGNAGDHVLDTFKNVPPYDKFLVPAKL